MLGRVDLLLGKVFAGIDLRQAAILVAVVALLAIFLLVGIGGDEAIEPDDRADGAQASLLALVVGGDLGGGPLDFSRRHLAGNAALPDQVVETQLVGIQKTCPMVGNAGEVGRADRLVRFLGVLGLGRIETRLVRNIAAAELIADSAARRLDRLCRHLHAVGTHIGDETNRLAADVDTFVQPLGDLHGGAMRRSRAWRRQPVAASTW